jgi:NAD+ kinase
MDIRKITIVVNNAKPGAADLAEKLDKLAKDAGIGTHSATHYPIDDDSLHDSDACCVIGGDGTLLGIVPKAITHNVPLFGIRMGNLGFLATFSPEEAIEKFIPLLKGEHRIEHRTLLQCLCPGNPPALALNDIVIKGEDASHLVKLAVHADGEMVTDYYCDGLIFSTPTGSTAYNISAGGPLIHPASEVVAMTPICPHTLTNRSVVFPSGTKLEATWKPTSSHSLPQVKVDGYLTLRPETDSPEPITILPAKQKLALLQSPGHSHFAVVRNKLNWR